MDFLSSLFSKGNHYILAQVTVVIQCFSIKGDTKPLKYNVGDSDVHIPQAQCMHTQPRQWDTNTLLSSMTSQIGDV